MAALLDEISARAEAGRGTPASGTRLEGAGTPILDPSAGLDATAREALEGGARAAVRRAGGGLSGSDEPRAEVEPAASCAAGGDSLTASSPADVAGTDVGASSTEVSQVCSSACWCDGFWKTRETRVPCAEGGVRRKEIRLSSEKSKPAG